mgnify:CR=1 FL=1
MIIWLVLLGLLGLIGAVAWYLDTEWPRYRTA